MKLLHIAPGGKEYCSDLGQTVNCIFCTLRIHVDDDDGNQFIVIYGKTPDTIQAIYCSTQCASYHHDVLLRKLQNECKKSFRCFVVLHPDYVRLMRILKHVKQSKQVIRDRKEHVVFF